jgi:hypothetical protein
MHCLPVSCPRDFNPLITKPSWFGFRLTESQNFRLKYAVGAAMRPTLPGKAARRLKHA